MEATVFSGNFNAAYFLLLSPFPISVPALYRPFLPLHGLVFALTCAVNYGTLYRQVCAFPNHVQSIEFTTGGLQWSSRNISRMINGNKMHMSSISILIAKGLNTYVNKSFLFNNTYTFAILSKGTVCMNIYFPLFSTNPITPSLIGGN
jgi:hypothetical protein